MSDIEIILTGVSEHAEGYPVKLVRNQYSEGKLVIQALNECGYNVTQVDFYELMNWVKTHEKEIKELEATNG